MGVTKELPGVMKIKEGRIASFKGEGLFCFETRSPKVFKNAELVGFA